MTDRLKLFKSTMPSEFVLFDYNPKSLTVTRQVKGGGRSEGSGNENAGGALDTLFYGTDPTTLQIRDAYLTGPETKLMCDHMLKWLAPDTGLGAAVGALLGLRAPKPPLIVAQWGPPAAGFMMTCVLARVRITYVRVDASGIPMVAKVTATLKESPLLLALTNPTSGGRPGRSRHVVSADESLASIATQAFGAPGAWRAIAEVNGIDDPASIRPGDVIHLPAPDELRAMAEATR